MHWIIQDNLHREEAYITLIETLDRSEIPYDVVKVVPFSDHLDIVEQMIPVIKPTGHVMVVGSTTLAKIANKQGWVPGSFLNENHDFQFWGKAYADYLLNADSKVCKFKDVEPIWSPFFIRPCADSKSFAGTVTDWEEFKDWQHKVIDLKEVYTSLDGDTLVSYCSIKKILKEFRFFVVDEEIVGESVYKIGSRVVYQSLVDQEAHDFAKKMIEIWQPARGFVIDIAMTDIGMKVVEVNNINSAGLYAIDVAKFVHAIEAMEF